MEGLTFVGLDALVRLTLICLVVFGGWEVLVFGGQGVSEIGS